MVNRGAVTELNPDENLRNEDGDQGSTEKEGSEGELRREKCRR